MFADRRQSLAFHQVAVREASHQAAVRVRLYRLSFALIEAWRVPSAEHGTNVRGEYLLPRGASIPFPRTDASEASPDAAEGRGFEPPKRGFLYIVVTKHGDDCEVVIVQNRAAARRLVSDQVRPPSKKSAARND